MVEAERDVLIEFGRCLSQIIHSSQSGEPLYFYYATEIIPLMYYTCLLVCALRESTLIARESTLIASVCS